MPFIFSIIVWPFIAFLAVWVITGVSVKKTKERQTSSKWFSYWIFSLIAIILLFFIANIPPFNIPLIQSSLASRSFGFLVEVLGLCIAIWARITLGRNWSASVTFKEKHELITKGPYKWVRHPIYTGMITMFLGAAIYLGVLAGLLAIFFVFLSFSIKLRDEEALMTKHFPKEYTKYRKTTKALIPFVY
jgi:protein-S-isoprenylcysteine O-methyltransferase Ste14